MTTQSARDDYVHSETEGRRCAALRRFRKALADLERCIDQVRAAAESHLLVRPTGLRRLRVLDELQRILQHVQAFEQPPAKPWIDQSSKTNLALDALWAARKDLRKTPAAAVERLGAVDLEGVDPRVVQEVYGAWLWHCRRLGLSTPFKYEAGFGRGAVVVPIQDGGLRVVSSIGMPDWPPGTAVTWQDVPGAKPLE